LREECSGRPYQLWLVETNAKLYKEKQRWTTGSHICRERTRQERTLVQSWIASSGLVDMQMWATIVDKMLRQTRKTRETQVLATIVENKLARAWAHMNE